MASLTISGFKLYRYLPGKIGTLMMPSGQVDYQPHTKYRHEKTNAFDPTFIHRKGKYHEDTFELQAILTPSEYDALLSFITSEGALYIEFNATPTLVHQFPIVIDKYPKCPDDLHEFTDKITFTAKSIYRQKPQYIDFTSIAIVADDDEIVSLY